MRLPTIFRWATRSYATAPGAGAGAGGAGSSKDIYDRLLTRLSDEPSRNMRRASQGRDGLRGVFESFNVTPPRTGVYAGRSVVVSQPEDLPRAAAQLNQINRINKMREVKNLQRYHERPGKARWRIRMQRKRREFRAGMRVLFHLALEAEKRGL